MYSELLAALADKPETVRLQEISVLPEHSDLLRMMRSRYSFGLVPDFEFEVTDVGLGRYFLKHLLIYRL